LPFSRQPISSTRQSFFLHSSLDTILPKSYPNSPEKRSLLQSLSVPFLARAEPKMKRRFRNNAVGTGVFYWKSSSKLIDTFSPHDCLSGQIFWVIW
jgi:hypothetical protein